MGVKMKKFSLNILTVSLLSVSVMSTPSYAMFGIADTQINDIFDLINKGIQGGFQALQTMAQQIASNKQSQNNAGIQAAVVAAQHKMALARASIPNAMACENIASNSSILAGGAASNTIFTNTVKRSEDLNSKKGTTNSQILALKNQTAQNCSYTDGEKGINGCVEKEKEKYKNNVNAKKDRDPSSLSGTTTLTVKKDGVEEVINYGDVILDDNKYKGKENMLNFLTKKYGIDPDEIEEPTINGTDKGQEYNTLRDTYMNRKRAAFNAELKIASKSLAMTGDDVTPALAKVWGNAKEEDLKKIYGKNYKKPKLPSDYQLLSYAVNKQFLAQVGVQNAVSGEGAQTQLLALNAKLLLELLEVQKSQVQMLGSLVAQSLNPVTRTSDILLDSVRTQAEATNVVGSGSKDKK